MDTKQKKQTAVDTMFFVMGAMLLLCGIFSWTFNGMQFNVNGAGLYVIGAGLMLTPVSFHHFKKLNKAV